MSVILAPEQILEKVREILSDVLSIPADQVEPQSRILEHLGAESIDLLDLRFRIEKAFGFRITSENLVNAFGTETTPEEFRKRFTVEALCGYVRRRLEEPVSAG